MFLDELPLYRGEVLESLRVPLETGTVRIARSAGAVCYPSRFSFIAAMNPCPCGYACDTKRSCDCTDQRLTAYRAKLSGPFIDRMDLAVTLSRLTRKELLGRPDGDSSSSIRARVEEARERQVQRWGRSLTNASVPVGRLRRGVRLTSESQGLVGDAIENLGLTGRGLDRLLRVARTIADLAAECEVTGEHLGKALGYRLQSGGAGVAA